MLSPVSPLGAPKLGTPPLLSAVGNPSAVATAPAPLSPGDVDECYTFIFGASGLVVGDEKENGY